MNLKIHRHAGPWRAVCGTWVMDAAHLAKPLQWEQVPERRRCQRCEKYQEAT